VDLHRLNVLVELSRRGTMRAVADATGYGTSAVSQQLTALEREVGTTLLVPDGRRVRLTAAGRRLVQHAETILAAVAAAETDLSSDAEPHGNLRVGSYATALRRWLLPAAEALQRTHPRVQLEMQEREPAEVQQLLSDDLLDVGLVYDYSLVPATRQDGRQLLCTTAMMLAVPGDGVPLDTITNATDLAVLRDHPWICNSRGADDDELTHRLCAMAGWVPVVRHRADSIELVIDMVAAGHGIALVPVDAPRVVGVRRLPMTIATIHRRTWSLTRPGRARWPATALLLGILNENMAADQRHPANDRTTRQSW